MPDLFDSLETAGAAGDPAPGQFRLAEIQLVNWGTFTERHPITVPRRGLLLTGESGSGKSSVLDAMTAIMVPPGEARFNAAASGTTAGDRERSLMSYVRGAYRKQSDDETQEIRTAHLRTGPTSSAISMTWTNGVPGRDADGGVRAPVTTVSAVRVFHVKGNSLAAQDLSSAFVLMDGPVDLTEWVPLIHRGINARRITGAFPGAQVYGRYPNFGNALRRRLGIGTLTAQRLLHRTLAAKSLNSLDALLRTFMLDEPDTFQLADTAVEQFVQLRAAHAAVVDAREQVEVLDPLRQDWKRREAAQRTRDLARRHQDLLPVYEARVNRDEAQRELERIGNRRIDLDAQQAQLHTSLEANEADRQAVRDAIIQGGGGRLTDAEKALREAESAGEHTRRAHREYLKELAQLDVAPPTGRAEHARVTRALQEEAERLAAVQDADRLAEPIARRTEADARLTALRQELASLARRRSRIDSRRSELRDRLADAVGQPPAALPYAGELADITAPEWAGALERLMGGFARTLVVPEALFGQVARLINDQHLGLRLEFLRADLTDTRVEATDPRAAARKLAVAPGRFEDWMRAELSRRFPHVCVDDVAELSEHGRALTMQGLVKGGARHVKDDRYRIDDTSRWVIGTRNDELVEALRERLKGTERDREQAQRQIDALEGERRERVRRANAYTRVAAVTWEEIDVAFAQERTARLRAELDILRQALETTHADLTPLRRRHEELREQGRILRAQLDSSQAERGRLEEAARRCEQTIADAEQLLAGRELTETEAQELQERLRAHGRTLNRASIGRLVGLVRQELQTEERRAQGALGAAENRLLRQQRLYAQQWPGRAVNLVPDDVASAPDFLLLLDQLRSDRLPEFEERFHKLLAEQSQNNLGQLAFRIQGADRQVRKRIMAVNESLAATPFDHEKQHWLRIETRSCRSGEVTDFLTDIKAITEGAFNRDDAAGAEARFERMNALLERLGSAETTDRSWRRRVLDTRLHITFVAVEYDASDAMIDVYEGSGGRSGGQGQKLVTFCLAAALRYQLADAGTEVPRYGTVALDEAFDKTDVNFTRASLEVFDSFRFQLVLATPLKMLQVIGPYVGGAATVSNPTGQDSQIGQILIEDGRGVADDGAAVPADAASDAGDAGSSESAGIADGEAG
ncbi:ATP-binding protein [Actinomyces sp.]|uniref:ATP-binding protein n=1 Tax=Actinomyces sp. TaxID=29317 RepID=UPI0026DAA2F8|nr:ATP-binding protein [Actinomyces sp.]MDO4899213.1 ATP-binding protein [Actinomyces sp.]